MDAGNSGSVNAGEGIDLNVNDGIDLTEAQLMALWLDPALRVVRLEAREKSAAAANAGIWDDPEVSFDLMRILASIPNPWITGGGLSFTVPLSGRLGIEKSLASAEEAAALQGAAAAEVAALGSLREKWISWTTTERNLELMRAYIAQLQEIENVALELAGRGELNPSEARVFQVERIAGQVEALQLEARAQIERQAILERIGLAPNAPPRLVAGFPAGAPSSVKDELDHERLLAHPRIAAALAQHEVSEQQLRLELARQRPDLAIGPNYDHEDGQSRIGFGLGLPIPLWNRNRQGIAVAEAGRDTAVARVIQVHDELLHELYTAQARQVAAKTAEGMLQHDLVPLIETQAVEIRRLAELGEVDVLLLRDAVSGTLAGKVRLLESRRDAALAASEVETLLAPTRPASRQQEKR